jgi:hypothetical protein
MKKQTTIKKAIKLQLAPEKVWNGIADFGNICHGHPSVRKSFIISDEKTGVGATRHCAFTMMGASADEQITEWNELENIKIKVVKLNKMPGIDQLTMNLIIEKTGNENETILKSEMEYTMKNAFFDFMNQVMMKKMNAKLVDGILAGHKKYLETGEIITEKTPLDLSIVHQFN